MARANLGDIGVFRHPDSDLPREYFELCWDLYKREAVGRPLFPLSVKEVSHCRKRLIYTLDSEKILPADVIRNMAAAESGAHSLGLSNDPNLSTGEREQHFFDAVRISRAMGVPLDILPFTNMAALRAMQQAIKPDYLVVYGYALRRKNLRLGVNPRGKDEFSTHLRTIPKENQRAIEDFLRKEENWEKKVLFARVGSADECRRQY